MKKFLLKVTLFSLPVCAICAILEIALRQIPNDYAFKNNVLEKRAGQIEALYLGSSHVYYGINPEIPRYKGFNAAYVSQSIDYDYEIFHKFYPKLNRLKFVVIGLDYFTLFNNLSNGKERWRVKNYEIYYDLDKSISCSDHLEIFAIAPKLNMQRVFSFYYSEANPITCSSLGFGIDKKRSADLEKTGALAAKRHSVSKPLNYKSNLSVLEKIVAEAQEKGAIVILFTSPAFSSYIRDLDPSQLSVTLDAATQLCKQYSNCVYYNFLEDKTFNASDFRDGDHLNTGGAQKLSVKLDSIMGQLGGGRTAVTYPASTKVL